MEQSLPATEPAPNVALPDHAPCEAPSRALADQTKSDNTETYHHIVNEAPKSGFVFVTAIIN